MADIEKTEVKKKEAASEDVKGSKKQRVRISQSDIPSETVEEALRVAHAIWDNFAGKPTAPVQVALAMGISPTSTNWRYISGASAAYGLTNGAYASKEISLTDNIGRKIVAPTADCEDRMALTQAVLTPTLLNRFLTNYNNAKFPKDNIAQNVLIEWGVPKDKASQVLDLIKANGEFAGVIVNTKTGPFVLLDSNKKPNNNNNEQGSVNILTDEADDIEVQNDDIPDELLQKLNIKKETSRAETPVKLTPPERQKVFITHGKNRTMVEHLKELLIYGQFEPVVSVEREATAIPVPDKVFSDMSKCQAGIIHIEGEETLIDKDGKIHHKINENVLIEIGAAIALYGKKVILLCQKGITLPSNLQGLYRCEYEGDQLDYAATMKLLKTFNEFRN